MLLNLLYMVAVDIHADDLVSVVCQGCGKCLAEVTQADNQKFHSLIYYYISLWEAVVRLLAASKEAHCHRNKAHTTNKHHY